MKLIVQLLHRIAPLRLVRREGQAVPEMPPVAIGITTAQIVQSFNALDKAYHRQPTHWARQVAWVQRRG